MKRLFLSPIKEVFGYLREHGFKKTLSWFNSKDAPVIVQFAKYAIAGGIATVASQGTWLVLCFTVYPAFSAEEIQNYREIVAWIGIEMPTLEMEAMELTKDIRARNSTVANVWGWVLGNFVAYVVNALWVFEGGRHNRWLEFLYFTLISGFSTVVGLAAGPLLIKLFGISTGASQLSLLVTAVLVNYICRKLFVFSR